MRINFEFTPQEVRNQTVKKSLWNKDAPASIVYVRYFATVYRVLSRPACSLYLTFMPPGICPPPCICFIMLSMPCLFPPTYLAYPCHQASVIHPAFVSSCSQCPACSISLTLHTHARWHLSSRPTSVSSCSQCPACSLSLTLHTHATWHQSSSLHLFHHALNALPVP